MLFSIIIPTYNSARIADKFVREIMDFSKNSPFDVELIIVDDGSTDDTRVRLDHLQGQFPIIKTRYLPRNRGQHQAICEGLEISEGQFILTMDDDQYKNIHDLSEAYSHLQDNDLDLVYGAYEKKYNRLMIDLLYKLHLIALRVLRIPKGYSFRLIKRSAASALLNSETFNIDVELRKHTSHIGVINLKTQWKPMNYSRYNLSKILKHFYNSCRALLQ